jgi:hypothetical protein
MKQSLNILWGLVILLLVINLGILYALNLARQSAIQQLEKAEQMVYRLSQEKIA